MMQRLLWYSPIAVLCVVAVWQIQRAHSSELSPWKGGGFGMFSTVDQPAMRYLKVFLIEDGQERPVGLPAGLKPRTQRTKADPSEKNLQDVAEYLQGLGIERLRQWSIQGLDCADDLEGTQPQLGDEVIAESEQEVGDSNMNRSGAELRVELWRMRYDHKAKNVFASKFLEATVPLATSP